MFKHVSVFLSQLRDPFFYHIHFKNLSIPVMIYLALFACLLSSGNARYKGKILASTAGTLARPYNYRPQRRQFYRPSHLAWAGYQGYQQPRYSRLQSNYHIFPEHYYQQLRQYQYPYQHLGVSPLNLPEVGVDSAHYGLPSFPNVVHIDNTGDNHSVHTFFRLDNIIPRSLQSRNI